MLLGGISFWTPDIIIHALRSYKFSGPDVLVVTLLSLGSLLVCYGMVSWSLDKRRKAPLIAIPMLIGIWLLGSTAMMIGASYSGGGFASSEVSTWYGVALGLLPPYTFIMATYDGILGALLIAHVLMILMCVIDKKRPLA